MVTLILLKDFVVLGIERGLSSFQGGDRKGKAYFFNQYFEYFLNSLTITLSSSAWREFLLLVSSRSILNSSISLVTWTIFSVKMSSTISWDSLSDIYFLRLPFCMIKKRRRPRRTSWVTVVSRCLHFDILPLIGMVSVLLKAEYINSIVFIYYEVRKPMLPQVLIKSQVLLFAIKSISRFIRNN